jgi:hypothetical protein
VKWHIVAGMVLAVLCAKAVSAQSRAENGPAAPVVDHPLRISMIVWAASVSADQVTTYRFSSQYREMMHEENLLIGGLDQHPALLVAAGAAIDAATGWASYHFLREHPRLSQMAFYGAAAYRTYLAVHNVQMMRRADDLRTGRVR